MSLLFYGVSFGQSMNKDSLKVKRDSLKRETDRLHQQLNGCTEFEIHSVPKWADYDSNTITYFKNCMWSGTYIVVNQDSTFLFKHNGEGGANYLQMGNWRILNDSILVLTGVDRLTNKFIERMKQFEETNYKSTGHFIRQYRRHQNVLLKYEHLEKKSN